MKILVLGGTGAMGTHLVSLLAENRHTVIVTTRRKKNDSGTIKYVEGNAHNKAFISILLNVHYDVIVDFMSYKTKEFAERYEMYLKATNQYIFLSSARVYADSGNIPIKEDFPRLLDVCSDKDYLKTDEYALTKARQENILLNSLWKNWTIIRPYITYSEIRLQLGVLEKEYWLYRALRNRTIVFSNDIVNNTTTLTYGRDVSRAIAAVIGQPKAFGEAFHITGEHCLKWRDVLNIYTNVIHKQTGISPSCMFTEQSLRLKYPEAKWQVKYDRYFNRRFDNSKIGQFIDINSFIEPEDGLALCMEQFLKNSKFDFVEWKQEGVLDNITEEVANVIEFKNKRDYILYKIYRAFPLLVYLDIFKQNISIFLSRR